MSDSPKAAAVLLPMRIGSGFDVHAFAAGRRLVIGGVDPADLTDPMTALAAIEAAGFVVSLEVRESAVTAMADVATVWLRRAVSAAAEA